MESFKGWLKNQWKVLFPVLTVESIEEKPLFEQTILILEQLDPVWYRSYRQSYGSGVSLPSLYTHLDLYTRALEQHVQLMNRPDGTVVQQDCVSKIHHLQLNFFFISHDGYYGDVPADLLNFKEVAMELCQLLHNEKTKPSKHGGYNIRVLTPLVENIRAITLTLLSIQKETVVTPASH